MIDGQPASRIAGHGIAWTVFQPVRQLTSRLAAGLTTLTTVERDATNREDAETEAIFQQSRLGGTLIAAGLVVARSWTHSVVGRRIANLVSTVSLLDFGNPARAVCWMAAVAAVTALMLRQLASRAEPLTWIVPAAVAGVALVVVVRIPSVPTYPPGDPDDGPAENVRR